jgi:hypothetical protein
MATIKLSDGKVVLKTDEGVTRASCTCCAEDIPDECCMYPAVGLDTIYSQEDLPETVVARGQDNAYAIQFQKTQGISPPYEGEAEGQQVRINLAGGVWSVESYDEGNDSWTGFQDTAPNPCLIFDPPSENAARVEDTFADTYTSTCTTDTGTTTKTYEREGLCVWYSRNANNEIDGALYYRTNATQEEANEFGLGRVLWALSEAGFRTEGDGPYNSPAGSYGANGPCVVSEEL